MPRIASRIAAITPSATLVVDSKAKALKADGQPVIGFGAGEPDFPTPAHIVEAARQALNDPKNFRYSPSAGLPELKQAIAEKTLRDSGVQVEPSQVLVTNGGKQAVYEAFAAVIDTGDDVLLPAPYWTTYPECIRLAGGNPIEVFAGSEQDYKVTVEQLVFLCDSELHQQAVVDFRDKERQVFGHFVGEGEPPGELFQVDGFLLIFGGGDAGLFTGFSDHSGGAVGAVVPRLFQEVGDGITGNRAAAEPVRDGEPLKVLLDNVLVNIG